MNPKQLFISILFLLALVLPMFSQVTADFFAYPRENCTPPYEVTFQNISQGDTAWLWDFGDGNSSIFPHPIHVYASADTFTVTLISYGPSGSDTLVQEDYVITLPAIPAPVLAKSRDTVLCGRGTTLRASGPQDLVWYDLTNKEVARGDSFHIPVVSSNTSYRVCAEEVGPSLKLGPATDTTIGSSGAFSNANRGLQFDVYRPIVLKSVLVYANAAGLRQISLEDTFGVVLKVFERFLYPGAQRVSLDAKLLPGNYQLTGSNLDLYTNTAGTGNPAAYPYVLPDYLTINRALGTATDYYYFYDWEVASLCRSPFSQVDVVVQEIPQPVFSTDTAWINCGYEGLITASADSIYEIQWFDRVGTQVASGDSLYLPFIDSTETFFAKSSYVSPVFSLGPEHPDSLGNNRPFGAGFWGELRFEVFAPVELQSFLVLGLRTFSTRVFQIKKGRNVLKTISWYVSNGPERVVVNLKLMPGTYTLVGLNNSTLYRNENVPIAYPFTINNLISITESTDGNDNYNFYYDWRVRALCESELDSVHFQVGGLDPPVLNKLRDTLLCGDSTHFMATASDAVVWYDQEDSSVVHRGLKLHLPSVTKDKSFFVRTEYERPELKVGPTPSGGTNSNADEGVIFTVHKDILIKSVRVYTSSRKTRSFSLLNAQGDTLKTFSFYVASGGGRLPLNIELPPGTYTLRGRNLDFARTSNNINFPYSIPGLIDIIGNTTWTREYSYFFDWRVTTLCKSAAVQVDIKVNERASPVIQADTIITRCGESTALIAHANGNVHWYNANGYEIGLGDTLAVPFASASHTYYARQKVNNQRLYLGFSYPAANGTRIYYNTTDERGLLFTVYDDLILRSVLVEADTAGIRHLVIRLADGTIYQTRDIMIPAGISRIQLDITFSPGSYTIGGTALSLFSSVYSGPFGAFPFKIHDLLSIDAAVVSPTINTYYRYDSYYHFFDWEIETSCGSKADSVYLQVDPFTPKPIVTPASFSLDCVDSIQAYAVGANVMWFDQQGNVISEKDSLVLDRVAAPTTLYAQRIIESPSVFDGLRYNPIWDGGIANVAGPVFMHVDVFADVDVHSFFTNADTAGLRTIFLRDSSGIVLDTFELFIPAGLNRIPLQMQLSPGTYQIGGEDIGLAFQDQQVQYPYDIGGLISVRGNDVDSTAYFYFFEWEVRNSCISDPVAVPVHFVPIPSPVVGQDTVDLFCNEVDTLLASGRDHVIWYDKQANLIAEGDSLFIKSLQDSTTFYAANQSPNRFFFGGPSDSTQGTFNPSLKSGLIFDVYQDVTLRSVKVYARSAGSRLIVYRDALGNIIDSVRVLMVVGEQRVYLDFPLHMGQNFELSIQGTADLFRDTSHVNFPYKIGSLLSLTQSNSSQGQEEYHYFYDWEVGDYGCQSAATAVEVNVIPFVNMSTISGPDSICYGQQATFSSSIHSGKWIDSQGQLLAISDSFRTPSLISDQSYAFVGESDELIQSLGPKRAHSLGPGTIDTTSSATFLYFNVDAPLRLNSVWIQADKAGMREIDLLDGNGNLLQRIRKFIPTDSSRMYLSWELQPGDYAIGGDSLYLYRNNSSASYPYKIPEFISITGTNKDLNNYYYFYDWEVQAIPCEGDTIHFDLEVLPQLLPAFSYSQVGDSVIFANTSIPDSGQWHWDFGDGDSSTLANPIHVYVDTGHFVVTLRVSNGICEKQYMDTVFIPASTDAIGELPFSSFRIYPNPGHGHFIVEVRSENSLKIKMEVYDLQGRKLFHAEIQRTTHFQEEVDLDLYAAGIYIVQVWAGNRNLIRKYIKR